MSKQHDQEVKIRKPVPEDGANVWQLVRDAGKLDVNSAYCYILLCDLYRDTCAVAEADGKLCGFVSALIRPDQPDCLFVWQIAVASDRRGSGIGGKLLQAVLGRERSAPIHYVEATISPDNEASARLFLRLAEIRDTDCQVTPHYSEELFPAPMQHEAELLYRIGPMTPVVDQRRTTL